MSDVSNHPVDEKLPTGKLAALGLQHVLVMYAGAVAVPLIVGRASSSVPKMWHTSSLQTCFAVAW